MRVVVQLGWTVSIAAFAVSAAAPAHAVPAAGIETGLELATQAIAWISGHVQAILASAYDRAPALVVVMAALLIIPITALVALLAHGLRLRLWPSSRPQANAAKILETFNATVSPAGPEAAFWPQTAWLAVDGPDLTARRLPLPRAQGLVRIGRHEDNDIHLPTSTVHRHHALIHRTPDSEFVIMDLSGQSGNGIVVNGEKRAEARLTNGDTILLGDARLRFESAPL